MDSGANSQRVRPPPGTRGLRRFLFTLAPLAAFAALLRFDSIGSSHRPATSEPPSAYQQRRAATVAGAWNGEAACLSGSTPDPAGRAATQLDLLARAYPLADDEVGGYRLSGQPTEGLNAFRTLMARNPKAAHGPAPDPGCRDLVCAAGAAFGADLGPMMLILAVDYQVLVVLPPPSSGLRWTATDLHDLLAALDDLPPSLFPLREEEYRSVIMVDAKALPPIAGGRAMALSGETTTAITLSTLWRTARRSERRATIVHEFAHDFTRARGMFLDWRQVWADAQADDANEALARGLQPEPVSAYAAANLDEDFAESVAAYRYMPQALLRRGAHRYAFLRQWMFDELEYAAPPQCAPDRARSRRAETMALIGLYTAFPSGEDLADAAMVCAQQHDRKLCSVRFFYIRAYRKAWNRIPAAEPMAAMAAIDGQLHATGLVNRAIARLPPNLVATLASQTG